MGGMDENYWSCGIGVVIVYFLLFHSHAAQRQTQFVVSACVAGSFVYSHLSPSFGTLHFALLVLVPPPWCVLTHPLPTPTHPTHPTPPPPQTH